MYFIDLGPSCNLAATTCTAYPHMETSQEWMTWAGHACACVNNAYYGQLILLASFSKSNTKWPTSGKLWDFPVLYIWRRFHSQISGVSDLRWTCLLLNNVCNVPLMYIASFWNLCPRWPTFGILRDSPYLTYIETFPQPHHSGWLEMDMHTHEQCL